MIGSNQKVIVRLSGSKSQFVNGKSPDVHYSRSICAAAAPQSLFFFSLLLANFLKLFKGQKGLKLFAQFLHSPFIWRNPLDKLKFNNFTVLNE